MNTVYMIFDVICIIYSFLHEDAHRPGHSSLGTCSSHEQMQDLHGSLMLKQAI
uniref:Uncharacterized protein n=1 Tax=Rhizophagus irregularis (strain DAOM 181602 / DAOM 197198 / MUCL 43194) TaxID=747089 RepID=U9TLU2_RHIID